MSPQTHRIVMPGGEFIVIDWTPPQRGTADAAVFVHGLGSHRRGDKALHFAERFATLGWGFLSLDLRGHGESSGSMRQLSLSHCLEDLAAVLRWLPGEVAPRLLIGSSMGSAVVAWHSVLHPDPRSLSAFIAPSFNFPHRWAEQLSAQELADWKRAGVRNFHSDWIDLEVGWDLMEDAKRYDLGQLVKAYATPSLILHGMKDVAVDWRASVQFVEACPFQDLQLLLIKDGDHRLTEQKAYLFDAMVGWLRNRRVLHT